MLKKLFYIGIAMIISISVVGCSDKKEDTSSKLQTSVITTENIQVDMTGIQAFTYKVELNKAEQDNPAIKKDNFKNITETLITNKAEAIAQAKKELSSTLEYDISEVFYDKNEKMWLVHLQSTKFAGGDPTIFLNYKGITKRILAGE